MNKSKAFQVGISLGVGALLVCILILLYSREPLRALYTLFIINGNSLWYFGNMLDKQTLLIFASLGSCFAFKVGLFNLGGEGQIYLSATLTAVLLEEKWEIATSFQLLFVFCFVFFILFLLGLLLGILKAFYNIDEIISSFLISLSTTYILNFFILERMKNTSSVLIATKKIENVFNFKSFLPPSTLNLSFFIAIFLCIFFYFFFEKTKTGYKFKLSGSSPEFAKFVGFNNRQTIIFGMAISSVMHALTGFFAIVGTYRMCHSNFSNGLGWAAIVVALIAGKNVLLIIPSSFLYAYLLNAQDAIVAKGLVVFDASLFFQGAIFLFISANLLKMKISTSNSKCFAKL